MNSSNVRQKALQVYNRRLVEMMKDYNISLKQAIYWDMGGFGHSYIPSDLSHVYHYLYYNGVVHPDDIAFYSNILSGKTKDIVLKK